MTPTLTENASWLVNAGADDTQRRLAAMTGTPEDIADLHHAIEHELANGNRVSRLKPIQARLAKFQRGAPQTGLVEILRPPDLSLQNNLDSIRQASALSAIAHIKNLQRNQDGYGIEQLRVIFDDALTLEIRANPQRRAVIQSLKQAIKTLPPSFQKLPIETLADEIAASRASSEVEILTPAKDDSARLSAHATRINETIDLVKKHQDAFEDATLEPRLLIGLEIVKAQEIFTLSSVQSTAVARDAKALLSHRDNRAAPRPDPAAASLGFSKWLAMETPDLKRPTAIKYATAFRSLGLPMATATPAQIRARIKDIRHQAGKAGQPMPSLHSLYKAGKAELPGLPPPPEDNEDPTRLGDARVAWVLWREQAEKLVAQGVLDDLDTPGLKVLKEFTLWFNQRLTARLKA